MLGDNDNSTSLSFPLTLPTKRLILNLYVPKHITFLSTWEFIHIFKYIKRKVEGTVVHSYAFF